MNYLISSGIFVLIAGAVGGYAFFLVWALGTAGVPLVIILFGSFFFVMILIALVVAFWTRIREIRKEEKDDYHNY